MRARAWSLVVTSLVLGGLCSAAESADKTKPNSPVPPPEVLTLSVEVTPPGVPPPMPAPKPAPPPVAGDPCAVLRKQLASMAVHFEVDRSTMTPGAVREVAAIGSAIKASRIGPVAEFSVEGHCETSGSDSTNVGLSERRAKTVLDRLVALGAIRPNQAKTVARGKEKPLESANAAEAQARNRRVEVRVYCPVP